MPDVLHVRFAGGDQGAWLVDRITTIAGHGLEPVERVAVIEGAEGGSSDARWVLNGVTSHHRYTDRQELTALRSTQAGLGRQDSTLAALIPIKKNRAWWELPQDERRAIFEQQSRHISSTLKYLPRIARRLHHSRELGEPFDFLTWFEYAPADEAAFDELVAMLRATEEWSFVEREVDLRLSR